MGVMHQTAIFVDAGYLLSEGALLLFGERPRRAVMRIDTDALFDRLRDAARAIDDGGRLLRIYWYDGLARGDRMSLEQQRIAHARDLKARFGRINMNGQQKGVDSLLVTDLIELARSQAIGDALIVSGDEDLGIAVAIAQSHGVRVHLLGISPAHQNQSVDLQDESDSLIEWGKEEVQPWLALDEAAAFVNALAVNTVAPLVLAKAVVPLVAQAGGKLIAISSRMGSIADNDSGGFIAYRATKAGLNAAWHSLAIEVKAQGVIAATLHPGWVQTRMGGASAPLGAQESVSGMRRVIEGLAAEQSGGFYAHDGAEIPW